MMAVFQIGTMDIGLQKLSLHRINTPKKVYQQWIEYGYRTKQW